MASAASPWSRSEGAAGTPGGDLVGAPLGVRAPKDVWILLADLAQNHVELLRTCRRADHSSHLIRRQTRLPRVRIAGAVPDIFHRSQRFLICRHQLGEWAPRCQDVWRPLHARGQSPGALLATIHYDARL